MVDLVMSRLFILVFSLAPLISYLQNWEVSVVQTLPFAVSNNAVCEGFITETPYVFSFAGIDSTRQHSGIHLNAYRYNTVSGEVETLDPLPDSLGKIAAGASRIGNIIYIIGGYHVFANGNEISSNKVHRYNITQNVYLNDGAPIPVAIDDHVQAVWRDSLIYVVTGWSNTGNVSNVQVYNPALNEWQQATSVPNNNTYKCFGASGTIVGDTIYYFGGARYGSNFPITSVMRKGVINPNNPLDISWSDTSIVYNGYRPACTITSDDIIHWIGGSNVTYNYNGIAYNGSGAVDPANQIIRLENDLITKDSLPIPMDLRGIANISENVKFILGGMEEGPVVSNKIYKLVLDNGDIDAGLFSLNTTSEDVYIYPNYNTRWFQVYQTYTSLAFVSVEVFNGLGQKVYESSIASVEESIILPKTLSGLHWVYIYSENDGLGVVPILIGG